MGALPRADVSGAEKVLNDALHELHHRAGWPSLRVLARETGVSHTTVSKVFSAPVTPTWGALQVIVGALDGDESQFHQLWIDATTPAADSRPVAGAIAGRRAELAELRRHLSSGAGLLLLMGEAGIGKTTVVTAAGLGGDATLATGRCLPLATAVPLMPVVDLLAHLHAAGGGSWFDRALAAAPAYARAALERLVPDLAPHATPPPLDDGAPHHLFRAVYRFLTALNDIEPVALVLEDLHWGDPATLDLLEHLVVEGLSTPVVATWRTNDPTVSATHRAWLGRIRNARGTTEMRLGPLTEDETREQLLLQRGIEDPAVARQIQLRTRGHPLFTFHLTGQRHGTDRPLPDHLAELLAQRLADLPDHAARIVSVLAIAGRDCSFGLVEESTGLDPEELVDGLHVLADRHLLGATESEAVVLGHPLLGDAAMAMLVPGEAARWHRRLAGAMSQRPGVEAAEVAVHWQHAGAAEEELTWRLRAATEAHARTAPSTEAAQWLRVLDLARELPAAGLDVTRARIAAYDALELAGELGAALTVARGGAGEVDGAEAAVAAALLRRWSEAESMVSDDPDHALALVGRAIDLLQGGNATEELALALRSRASTLVTAGRYEEAVATMHDAVAACTELGRDDLLAHAQASLGWTLAYVGASGTGLAMVRQAADLAATSSDPRLVAQLGMLHTDALSFHRRAPEEFVDAARHTLDVAREWDLDFYLVHAVRANVVEALVRSGRVDEASRMLDSATGAARYDTWPITWVSALVATARGHLDDALSLARRLRQEGGRSENDLFQAGLMARVLLWMGEAPAAWAELEHAMRPALGKPVVGRTGLLFALLARAAADTAERAPEQRGDLLARLEGLRAAASVDPVGPGDVPAERRAATFQWEAELGRMSRADTPEQWLRAAREWERLHTRHEAAYCRWRGAQAAVRGGQGTIAARLLKKAAADAREHVPLSRAIAETARSAG